MTPREVIELALYRTLAGFGDDYTGLAAHILTALAAAGYVVVPREPTEGMLDVGGQALYDYESGIREYTLRQVWPAMIAAAEGK